MRLSFFIFEVTPKFVILARNASCHFGDEGLGSTPKVDLLEEGVHPSIDDAVA